MPAWLNHVAIAAPRNGSTSHTVNPGTSSVGTTTLMGGALAGTVAAGALFTPSMGSLLVLVVQGAVTSGSNTAVPTAPPTGWSAPSGNQAVNNTGLYVWTRTAAGMGLDQVTTLHNGSNYPVVFDFYEFPAGSTFIGSIAAVNVSRAGGAGPTLTGLTGTNWVAGAGGQGLTTGDGPGTVSWSTGTAQTAATATQGVTDGYNYGLTAIDASTATSASFAGTFSANPSVERLVFAVKVASGGTPATTTGGPARSSSDAPDGSGSGGARQFASTAQGASTTTAGTSSAAGVAVGRPACSSSSAATSPRNSRPYFPLADWLWGTIPTSPALDANSTTWVTYLAAGQHVADLREFGVNLQQADGSTPRYTVPLTLAASYGYNPLSGKTVPIPAGTTMSGTQPPSSTPGEGGDSHLAVADASTNRVYSMWQAQKTASSPDAWQAAYAGIAHLGGDGREFDGSSTAGNLSRYASVIRAADLTAAIAANEPLPYALFCSSDISATTYRYPASKSDAQGNNAGVATPIPIGTRLQLDPSVNVDAIPGITAAERVIAKTLQTRGAYVGDKGGSRLAFLFELQQPNSTSNPGAAYTAAGLSYDYYDMAKIPWASMRALATWDGSSPTTTSGTAAGTSAPSSSDAVNGNTSAGATSTATPAQGSNVTSAGSPSGAGRLLAAVSRGSSTAADGTAAAAAVALGSPACSTSISGAGLATAGAVQTAQAGAGTSRAPSGQPAGSAAQQGVPAAGSGQAASGTPTFGQTAAAVGSPASGSSAASSGATTAGAGWAAVPAIGTSTAAAGITAVGASIFGQPASSSSRAASGAPVSGQAASVPGTPASSSSTTTPGATAGAARTPGSSATSSGQTQSGTPTAITTISGVAVGTPASSGSTTVPGTPSAGALFSGGAPTGSSRTIAGAYVAGVLVIGAAARSSSRATTGRTNIAPPRPPIRHARLHVVPNLSTLALQPNRAALHVPGNHATITIDD